MNTINKFISHKSVIAIFSGLLTIIAMTQLNSILGWVCFVPLFISISNQSSKTALRSGFIFGLTMSVVAFSWMIPGAEKFTGNSIFYGIGVFLICTLFPACYFAIITYFFRVAKVPVTGFRSCFNNAVLVACIYCVGEAMVMYVSYSFPWFDYHTGIFLADNIYAIQPASYFGIHVITFIVILVNYLIAGFIMQKQWLKLFVPIGIIVAYLLCGFFILQNFESNLPVTKPVKVAIMSENIPPEIKWDDNTGNMLVNKLLDMNRTVATLKPNIALWSESAIPWTYRPNDDLVKEILKITTPAGITHVMGINTEVTGNEVYNSAYCLLPDGKMSGRYDKQILLALIERPLDGQIIPFFSSKGFLARRGHYGEPLNTPYGKAGVMICNESTVPSAAATMVKKGAEFIMNMSNDGWFSDTYIVGLHFYNVRLRAVETRKDIVINSNNGLSGLVRASGRIVMSQSSNEPFVNMVTIYPNTYKSLAVAKPLVFVYCCIAGLLFFIVKWLVRTRKLSKLN